MSSEQKSSKLEDLSQYSTSQLLEILTAEDVLLQKARFKHALGQLRETHRLSMSRKRIARVKTALTYIAKKQEQV